MLWSEGIIPHGPKMGIFELGTFGFGFGLPAIHPVSHPKITSLAALVESGAKDADWLLCCVLLNRMNFLGPVLRTEFVCIIRSQETDQIWDGIHGGTMKEWLLDTPNLNRDTSGPVSEAQSGSACWF